MYKKRQKGTNVGQYIELNLSKNPEFHQILDVFVNHLKEEHDYSSDKINRLFRKETELLVPDYIFRTNLSTLEAVVKYLKERLNLRYKEISVLLKRDERTIWVTYKNARKKLKKPFTTKKVKVNIPLSIFKNRKLSPLESLVFFLLYSLNFKNHQVCALLNKKPSTISTINSRVLKKNE